MRDTYLRRTVQLKGNTRTYRKTMHVTKFKGLSYPNVKFKNQDLLLCLISHKSVLHNRTQIALLPRYLIYHRDNRASPLSQQYHVITAA